MNKSFISGVVRHIRVSLVPLLMKIWRREAVLYTYILPYKKSQTLS